MRHQVRLSRVVQKKLKKALPRHVVRNLLEWAQDVEERGLGEVRKIPGYHDEPLKGKLQGQHSFRLGKAYRGFYVEEKNETVVVVIVREVNNHGY